MRTDPFSTALAVGVGAGLGALTRWFVLLGAAPGSLAALALTFAINAAGCFAMGWFKPGPLWGTGFLGGLTTYSAVAFAALQSSISGALLVLALSFAVNVAAWIAGDAARGRANA
ncbi:MULTISPECIES: CrcB family protein [Corynebacterium]|uniref:CrcB family protein n=1 Tax=Corynebacterium TaxID=1716 RepID=UPI001F19049A|nr:MULTISPECIES: CrcB family protein [Corynebacterium]